MAQPVTQPTTAKPKEPESIAGISEIIVGRDPEDMEKFGIKGCGIIGRHFVGERKEAHLTNPVLMDLARPHIVGVFGKRGTGKCLHPNTPIHLADGSVIEVQQMFDRAVRSGRIVENTDQETLVEFNEEAILTLLPNLRTVPARISHVYRKSVKEELIRVETQTGRTILVTKEHPLLTINEGQPSWIHADEFRPTDYIALSRKLPVDTASPIELQTSAARKGQGFAYGRSRAIKLPRFANREITRWLAYLIAEGTEVKQKTQARLGFTNYDERKLGEFITLTRDLFGLDPGRYRSYIYIDSIAVARFLEENGYNFGQKSAGKEIPQFVLRSSNGVVTAFLQAFFDCEASVIRDKAVIELTTASRKLALQLIYLLQRFGIFARLKEKIKYATNTPEKRKRKYFTLLLTSEAINGFARDIGFSDEEKSVKLAALVKKKRNPNLDVVPEVAGLLRQLRNEAGLRRKDVYALKQIGRSYEVGLYNPSRAFLSRVAMKLRSEQLLNLATSDLFWDRIVSVQREHYEGYVYDLTVPMTHNFIAGFGGIVCHNSYTLGIMAEEMLLLPDEIKQNLAAVLIDTMGIFWSLKSPNEKDFALLREWGLKPRSFEVAVLVPEGQQIEFRQKEIPVDGAVSIRPSDLNSDDWLLTFNIDADSEMGVLLGRVIKGMRERRATFSLADIVEVIKKEEAEPRAKASLAARFSLAEDWGIFSEKGTRILDIVKPGRVVIIDVSLLTSWAVRSLLIGLLARKILEERITARRQEETEAMAGRAKSYMPITWMIIDEAHQFVPSDSTTAATGPLMQWVKIGREPGVSLVMATQQPFKLHPDALSQCDMIIAHRLTAKPDIDALGAIMQTYLKYNISEYVDALPRVKGAAIVLDDNSERLFAIRARPRMSWHAGGSPAAIKE